MRECNPVLGPKAEQNPAGAALRISCVHTFGRLLGFLRPYRRGVVWSLVLAALAMVCTVAIPWLTGRAVDQISDGDRDGLRTLRSPSSAWRCCGCVLSVFRRLVAGRVSLAIEYDLRTCSTRTCSGSSSGSSPASRPGS